MVEEAETAMPDHGRPRLFTPGPVEVAPRVLAASSRGVVSHRSSEFRRLLGDVVGRLKRLLNVDGGEALVLPGSGTTAVDAMTWSLVPPGERVLVLSWGEFGERLAATLRLRGARVDVLAAPWGSTIDADEAAKAALRGGYRYVAVVHNETSTGVAFRELHSLAETLEAEGVRLLVDTVSGAGGEDIRVSQRIYAAATCSHKALASIPGVAIVALSRRAVEELEEAGGALARAPPSLDLWRHLRFLRDRGETPFTPPVNALYALREALNVIEEAGGVEAWLRIHARRAGIVYSSGVPPLPGEEDLWSHTVAAFKVRDAFRVKRVLEDEGFLVATGMGRLKGSVVRVGLMGHHGLGEFEALAEALSRHARPASI